MDDITRDSEFDFDSFVWPPTERISSTRFITNYEHIGNGGCRSAYLGKDTVTEQPVVIKKFLQNCDQTQVERYFTEDIDASRMAQQFAKLYNEQIKSTKPIYFVLPLIDRCTANVGYPFRAGEKVLIEPYLGLDYHKYNTNWGFEDNTFGLSMPTLSHFTYHATAGNMLLCDLQGVKKSDRYLLTDPVICSLTNSYGITDIGEDAIRSFFAHHQCTSLCGRDWLKHPNPAKYSRAPASNGTVFIV